MRLIKKEEELEIKHIKETNELLSNGYRAMSLCLNFEKAIISIMKQFNVNSIEIEKDYILENDVLETSENPTTDNVVIIIRKRG